VRRTRLAQGPPAYLSRAEEEALLEPFVGRARQGQIVVAAEIRAALEKRLGKRTAPSTVYNLLRRHGWRKLAPDRVHPQGNPPAQWRWKKKVASKTG
jgi:transposase